MNENIKLIQNETSYGSTCYLIPWTDDKVRLIHAIGLTDNIHVKKIKLVDINGFTVK